MQNPSEGKNSHPFCKHDEILTIGKLVLKRGDLHTVIRTTICKDVRANESNR